MLTNDEYKFILEHYAQDLEREIKQCESNEKLAVNYEYKLYWCRKSECAKEHLSRLKSMINNLTNSSGLSFMKGEEEKW